MDACYPTRVDRRKFVHGRLQPIPEHRNSRHQLLNRTLYKPYWKLHTFTSSILRTYTVLIGNYRDEPDDRKTTAAKMAVSIAITGRIRENIRKGCQWTRIYYALTSYSFVRVSYVYIDFDSRATPLLHYTPSVVRNFSGRAMTTSATSNDFALWHSAQRYLYTILEKASRLLYFARYSSDRLLSKHELYSDSNRVFNVASRRVYDLHTTRRPI